MLGLSDPHEPKFSSACSHAHEETCEKCSMVNNCVHIIREKMNSVFDNIPGNIPEELLYEIDVAGKDLLDWKKHICNENTASGYGKIGCFEENGHQSRLTHHGLGHEILTISVS